MLPRRLLVAMVAAASGAASAVAGCGTEAVGVESCRQIEEARCRRAPECGVDLSRPPHRGDDVEACVRYYDDACLHGLASKNDPGGPAVKACVDAIGASDCAVVLTPESHPACAFLVPPAPPPAPEAGADGGDGATDAPQG